MRETPGVRVDSRIGPLAFYKRSNLWIRDPHLRERGGNESRTRREGVSKKKPVIGVGGGRCASSSRLGFRDEVTTTRRIF